MNKFQHLYEWATCELQTKVAPFGPQFGIKTKFPSQKKTQFFSDGNEVIIKLENFQSENSVTKNQSVSKSLR